MTAMAWKRRFTGWLLRLPGAGIARRRVVGWLRRSTTVRSLVKRVFAIDTAGTLPLDVTAGRVLGGVGTEQLPVTLVVIVGAEAKTVTATVDEVARIQLMTAGFRPVIVADVPAFASARPYGYPFELLLPESEWDVSEHATTWDDYVRRRVGLLFATYRATASITLGRDGLDHTSRLVLSSLRPVAPAA
ncbi:MAG TPA: hypothetical protein VFZ63_14340 [Jiangellaceae bacterium]